MKKLIALTFICALCSCASSDSSVSPLYGSSQKGVYEAICNGTSYTMTECYRLANQKCYNRFKVLDQSETVATYVDNYGLFLDKDRDIKRRLVFKCL